MTTTKDQPTGRRTLRRELPEWASSELDGGKRPRRIDRSALVAMFTFLAIGTVLTAAAFVVPAVSGEDTTAMVVAAETIPAGATITDTMVGMREVPAAFARDTEGIVTDAADVIGKPARAEIASDAPILSYAIADATGANPNAQTFSLSLPAENFVNGLVAVGDTVDVYATYTDPSSNGPVGAWIAENVPVVSTGIVAAAAAESTEDAAGDSATAHGEVSLVLEAPPSATSAIMQARVLGSEDGTFVAKSTGMPAGHAGPLLDWRSVLDGSTTP